MPPLPPARIADSLTPSSQSWGAPFSGGTRVRIPRRTTRASIALIWLLLTVPAVAAATPLGAVLPGGCDFYIVVSASRDAASLTAVERLLPALPVAMQRLAAAGVLPAAYRPTDLALAGFLKEDTVYLAILLAGDFDEAALKRSLGPNAALLDAAPPPALYQAPAGGQPAIGFLVPSRGTLAAGRPDTLRAIFRKGASGPKPPALLLDALSGEGSVTIYAGREVLGHLFPPTAPGEGLRTLREIFAGISALTWTVESPREGRCRVRMQALRNEDAAAVGTLLRNYLNLSLLAAGQDEAAAAAVLKTFVVDTRDRQVDIRFSVPPETLEEIFTAMFRF